MLVDLYQPNQTWLLVTSASHMPRAMGAFRKEGMELQPWPVDFIATEPFGVSLARPSEHLNRVSRALKEWAGLLSYWIAGQSTQLFPK